MTATHSDCVSRVEVSLTSADGVPLRGWRWEPSEPAWCQLVLVHGLGEHVGRYDVWARRFAALGVRVVGVDLRGHGRSSGRRGAVRDLSEYLHDCRELMDLLPSETPTVLYGHSLGGVIALEYLRTYGGDQFEGAILTSPWLRLSVPPPPLTQWVACQLARWMPMITVHNGLRAESLGRPPEVAQSYRKDPLVHGRISVGLFRDAARAGEFWAARADSLPIPALLMHGDADRVTDWVATEQLAKRCKENASWQVWPDAVHELHHDTVADEVFEAMLAWLKGRVRILR